MDVDRRRFLVATGAAGAAVLMPPVLSPARGTPAEMQAAIRGIVGNSPLQLGRVTLDLPPLVENGNTVPLLVSVESPMTAADHVAAVHIVNEKNPQPHVVTFHFGPRSGHARASTRIRLADTQRIVAIAAMSDGSFWSGSAEVVVTLAACTEDS